MQLQHDQKEIHERNNMKIWHEQAATIWNQLKIKKEKYANLNNKENSRSHILLRTSLHEAFHNKNQPNLYY